MDNLESKNAYPESTLEERQAVLEKMEDARRLAESLGMQQELATWIREKFLPYIEKGIL